VEGGTVDGSFVVQVFRKSEQRTCDRDKAPDCLYANVPECGLVRLQSKRGCNPGNKDNHNKNEQKNCRYRNAPY